MAVRIRLLRMGKIRNPQYRIVVADSRTKRDGRAIENLGIYHPKEEPSRIEVNSERVQHWLSVGAQPSDPVRAILCKTGDWQKFKGLTPPPNPLRAAPARVDRRAVYEAEAKAAAGLADQPGKGKADQAPAKKAAKKTAKKVAKKAAPKAAEADQAGTAERAGSAGKPDPAGTDVSAGAADPAGKASSRAAEPAGKAGSGAAESAGKTDPAGTAGPAGDTDQPAPAETPAPTEADAGGKA